MAHAYPLEGANLRAKFEAIVEGARIAGAQLMGKAGAASDLANLTDVYNVDRSSAPCSHKL